MRANRGRDTKPELTIRRLLFANGYRFRIHMKTLPGRPDIVFTRRKKAILVNGCFWHQHPSPACPLRSRPKSHANYWTAKLDRNVERDRLNEVRLHDLGWQTLTIWECELSDLSLLSNRLAGFLGDPRVDQSRCTASAHLFPS
ncbi:MAG: very short patch repair endonuclease [Gemmatimonadetes bacterium]|nr:very short patch repair endonuclease [Gemmatimonadota bacterium]